MISNLKKFKSLSIIWTILFFVIAAIIIPIIVNIVSDLIFERLTEPSDPVVVSTQQPKELPKSSVMLSFWLDSVGQTQFNRGQAVICYYKVDAAINQPLFFSLFNRSSSSDIWSPVLEYEPIEVGKLYSFPPPLSSSQFVTQGNELRLEAGSEYFQAVVSAKPDEVLARKELVVEVR